MNFNINIGSWAAQKTIAQAIRYAVFVIEQKVPIELEWDDMDSVCLHAIAYDEHGNGIGTGRLLPDGHIGRMAVKKRARGCGVGRALLDALIATAQARGDSIVKLNAQIQAEAFYARHGFTRIGAEFIEAGIVHIAMHRVCMLK